jgi:succinate dehydrogenase flavin-adding protein (antitoxin of CptAB toxin-antitoxin module)
MLKKLIYKSHYRGTKEGDFILSSFAKNMLQQCSNNEIKMYETLLEYTDVEIHEWTISPQNAPTHLQSIIFKIAEFYGIG